MNAPLYAIDTSAAEAIIASPDAIEIAACIRACDSFYGLYAYWLSTSAKRSLLPYYEREALEDMRLARQNDLADMMAQRANA